MALLSLVVVGVEVFYSGDVCCVDVGDVDGPSIAGNRLMAFTL